MRLTEIDRRRFLGLVAAYGLAPMAVAASEADVSSESPLYLAARKNSGRFEAVLLDGTGLDKRVIPLPDRGHSFAIDAPRERVVAFGRQPGFFAIAFGTRGQAEPETLVPAQNRHFFGHGVFSPDGNLMFATENDYVAGRGVVGVYDASPGGRYRRVGEFASEGVGPHEVVLLPDGKTLCIANGGILTHPDYGKLQLNAETMQPSLTYVDSTSGALIDQVALEPKWSRLSIRHLVVDRTGTVWFGCQHTGPAQERPPLVGRHRRGGQPELFAGPEGTLRRMKNYVGSLACNMAGTLIATSSPVGGVVVFWDAATGNCAGSADIFDGCGVAPRQTAGFLISSGQGRLFAGGPHGCDELGSPGGAALAWDNHLRRI